jgi:prepilin-type N-terminal cleavage/methylation domain-containing protein
LNNLRKNKAFTLIEVLVASALLVMVVAMAGTVFRVGIESHSMAQANGEIMQKFRSITDQLNADFRGLCKEGEIYIAWPTDQNDTSPDYGRHVGLDRIVFFTKGDFQSYNLYNNQVVRGNVARVSYMLGSQRSSFGTVQTAGELAPSDRVLQRTQHILTQNDTLNEFEPLFDVNDATDEAWYQWHNALEYDRITLQQWLDMNDVAKFNALSVITNIKVQTPTLEDRSYWGSQYDVNEPQQHAHSVLSEGVGAFKIQAWFEAQGSQLTGKRWVPDEDPNLDGSGSSSELLVSLNDSSNNNRTARVLYPGNRAYAFVSLGGEFDGQSFDDVLSEDRFNEIPGLGRALKFTFTLYDSKGLIPKGRTFTHIVYLDR